MTFSETADALVIVVVLGGILLFLVVGGLIALFKEPERSAAPRRAARPGVTAVEAPPNPHSKEVRHLLAELAKTREHRNTVAGFAKYGLKEELIEVLDAAAAVIHRKVDIEMERSLAWEVERYQKSIVELMRVARLFVTTHPGRVIKEARAAQKAGEGILANCTALEEEIHRARQIGRNPQGTDGGRQGIMDSAVESYPGETLSDYADHKDLMGRTVASVGALIEFGLAQEALIFALTQGLGSLPSIGTLPEEIVRNMETFVALASPDIDAFEHDYAQLNREAVRLRVRLNDLSSGHAM